MRASVDSPHKVVRIRYNLQKYLRDALEFIELMLEYSPPWRTGRYRIHMRVHIEELDESGEVAEAFEFERIYTKTLSV